MIILDRYSLPIQAERYRRSLYEFVKAAWHVVEATPYSDNWHIEEICVHLEALYRLEIKNLAIALPPGTSKSLISFVFFPVWCWLQDPGFRFGGASVDITLALRDARRSRELVESQWFKQRWNHVQLVGKGSRKDGKDRSDAGSTYWTDKDGLRFSTSTGSKAVGWHLNLRAVDDPIKPSDATLTKLKYVREDWWCKTMSSRALDRKTFRSLINQQRIAKQDLIGYAQEVGYTCLVLPMEYSAKRRCVTPFGGDRRKTDGELLVPERIGPKEVEEMKSAAGLGRHYESQCNQNPSDDAAVIFTEEDFQKKYKKLPAGGHYIWSWDVRFKSDRDSGSYVVGLCAYLYGNDVYLVTERRDRWSFTESRKECCAGAKEFPGIVLIEDKANGPAIEDSLKKEIPGIVLSPCRGSKTARGNAVTPFVGHVHLPRNAPWTEEWVKEVCNYPAEPNDRGDTLCQLLRHVYLPAAGEVKTSYRNAIANMGR